MTRIARLSQCEALASVMDRAGLDPDRVTLVRRGELPSATADAIDHRVRDLSRWGRPIVLASHHPPLPHAWRAWQWIDERDAIRVSASSAQPSCAASPGLASTILEKGRAA